MSDQYNENTFTDIIKELDKETARIIISKEIRGKYKKISTVIRGIENPESIRSELKRKIGTGAPIKKDKLFFKEIIERLSKSC